MWPGRVRRASAWVWPWRSRALRRPERGGVRRLSRHPAGNVRGQRLRPPRFRTRCAPRPSARSPGPVYWKASWGRGRPRRHTAVETPQPPAPLALRTGPRRGLPRGAPLSSGAAWQRPGAESREVFPRQLAVQGGRWAWGEPPPDPVTGARVRHWRGGWLGAPASFSENSLVGLSGRWAREEHRGSNQLGGRKRGPGAARRPRTASEGSRSQAERASGTDEMFVQDASGRCLEEGGVLSPSGPRPPARRRGRGASPAPHAALVTLGPVPSSCPCVTSARVRVASKTSLEAGVRT